MAFEDDAELTEDDVESEFPAGDGTVDTEATIICPHCGELNTVSLDPGSGGRQEYVEDCQVCCWPWLMYVTYDRLGHADIEVHEN